MEYLISPRDIFGLLGLPHELRDMIYDSKELLETRYYEEECPKG